MCSSCCNAQQEQVRRFEKVCRILDKHQHNPSRLIPILQEVQKEYRYLPEEVMAFIATSLGISPAKVYGVASFYANFALKPKGKYVIHICEGTACHVKGSGKIKDALFKKLNVTTENNTTPDMLFTVQPVSCLGACGLAPVMTVNEEVHGQVTPEAATAIVDEIIKKERN
ncbi:MAG TPA: NADH-quinone oxidoreductase subunit NuoE [Anaerohalosphaeraceae bacterium]|nr:NADH-quinone oxidoreductase subunit NuoE [Anaerohalosphaeraceae bacterium]